MRKITKFVVAYDKFKDCLKASQLCSVTKKALEGALGVGAVRVNAIPLADGGDGFLDCIEQAFASSSRENAIASSHLLFRQYAMNKVELAATGPLGAPVSVSLLLRVDFVFIDETKEWI
eukprot:TRINITY_DN14548_c0_g1_i7.p1 TRINITY_DN14548_c0_g1~~TRINITY_DN14548_c0_g1_i7.p1  ORF type:complete len:119 (-),score=32.50 TRINITY_DN14548_c0_g1_i7:265-621(-)